jgi:CRP-like cAMP-binding protein
MFCELFHRLRAALLMNGEGYALPLRQSDLAEASGLSDVHVNRCLHSLRTQDLIELGSRWLTILNHSTLQQASQFSPNYLHLSCRAQSPLC